MTISVGAAVGEGFRLIARRPFSVLAWGAAPTALQVLAFGLIGPMYIAMLTSMARGGPAAALDPSIEAHFSQLSGLVQLINLAQLFVSVVTYCAVFRAVLHPEQSSFAFMRIGMPEFFMTVLIVGAFIAFVIAMLVLMIPAMIAVGVSSQHSADAGFSAVFVALGMVLVGFLVAIYFGLRFSLVGPMMVDDGAFHFGESWRLTRGRMGSLSLLAVALIGVFILVELVYVGVFGGLVWAAVSAVGGPTQAAAQLRASPQALFERIAPFLIVYLVLLVPVFGVSVAMAGAPFARVYKDLKPDAAEAFA